MHQPRCLHQSGAAYRSTGLSCTARVCGDHEGAAQSGPTLHDTRSVSSPTRRSETRCEANERVVLFPACILYIITVFNSGEIMLAVLRTVLLCVVALSHSALWLTGKRVNSSLYQAMKVQRGSRSTAVRFLKNLGARWGAGGQRHASATLSPGNTRYPLYRKLGGLQDWCGQVQKISPQLGFDPINVQLVASHYTN